MLSSSKFFTARRQGDTAIELSLPLLPPPPAPPSPLPQPLQIGKYSPNLWWDSYKFSKNKPRENKVVSLTNLGVWPEFKTSTSKFYIDDVTPTPWIMTTYRKVIIASEKIINFRVNSPSNHWCQIRNPAEESPGILVIICCFLFL